MFRVLKEKRPKHWNLDCCVVSAFTIYLVKACTTLYCCSIVRTHDVSHFDPVDMCCRSLDAARALVVADGSGEDSEAAAMMTRRRAEENLEIISQEDLNNLDMVIVLQDEGIVFCPIPKVNGNGIPARAERMTADRASETCDAVAMPIRWWWWWWWCTVCVSYSYE